MRFVSPCSLLFVAIPSLSPSAVCSEWMNNLRTLQIKNEHTGKKSAIFETNIIELAT